MARKMKPVSSVRELRCRLTDTERQDRVKELLDLNDKLEELDEELKAAKDEIKSRKSEVEVRLKQLRGTLRSGEEEREVRCTTSPDWDTRKMVTVRDDTGTVLESRPMTESELQGKLFDVSKGEEGEAPTTEAPAATDGKPGDAAAEQAAGHLADAPVSQQATGTDGGFPEGGTLTREQLDKLPTDGEAGKPAAKKPTSRQRRQNAVRSEGR
jgi:DNA gyrase/topoisomerase IV subunit A